MASATDSVVETWKKRIDAAVELQKEWVAENRVEECLRYYRGKQLENELNANNIRRVQINKIHPEVRNNIPSLYYYKPFARLSPAPEQLDDPGTQIEQDTQLLQDTANHLIRDPETMFRESTFLALKEAHWAFGCVEVGYSAEFVDAPNAQRPPLKEKKDTKIDNPKPQQMGLPGMAQPGMHMMPDGTMMSDSEMPEPGMDQMGLSVDSESDLASIEAEVEALKGQLKSERFFVKHIPWRQVLISVSDKATLGINDWVGYWEDVPLEDVKKSKAYSNTGSLKSCTGDEDDNKRNEEYSKVTGSPDPIRLYKIWDLRTKTRYVFAAGHGKKLLEKPFKRNSLKFLRFDVDPEHFHPRPLILSKLSPQDEYNASREFIQKVRDRIVARFTYDEDAFDAKQIAKFESGDIGAFIPRKGGFSPDSISPVVQPSYSENAIQALTLSDKEFADVGGVGSDPKIAQSKTATQAKIAETKNQVQDSFDRLLVAEWLSDIVKELVALAIENMNVDRWVAINVVPQSQFTDQISQDVAARFQRINANLLSDASRGINWDVTIDLENLSPVSEEEKFQKLMQGLALFGNPPMARLFAVSPDLLELTLNAMGIKSGRTQQLIAGAMQAVVQMEQQLAMAGQNAAPGVSPQAGSIKPPTPTPKPSQPKPGGPQPGGPPGPGTAQPKM